MTDKLPDNLQSMIEEYNRNFQDIDELLGPDSVLENAADKETRAEATREVLSNAQLIAARTLLELMVEGESETVRFNCAKFVIESNLGKDIGLEKDKGVQDLITRLQKAPASVTSEDDTE